MSLEILIQNKSQPTFTERSKEVNPVDNSNARRPSDPPPKITKSKLTGKHSSANVTLGKPNLSLSASTPSFIPKAPPKVRVPKASTVTKSTDFPPGFSPQSFPRRSQPKYQKGKVGRSVTSGTKRGMHKVQVHGLDEKQREWLEREGQLKHGTKKTKTAKPTTWSQFSAAFGGENELNSNRWGRKEQPPPNTTSTRARTTQKQKTSKKNTHGADSWASKGHKSANKSQNPTTTINENLSHIIATGHAIAESNVEVESGLTEQSTTDRDFALALQMQQEIDAAQKPPTKMSHKGRKKRNSNSANKAMDLHSFNRRQRKWLAKEGQITLRDDSANTRKQKKQQIKMTWGNFHSTFGGNSGPTPDAWNRQDLAMEVTWM